MKRYEHIDIAKGIGILLVVFFHLPNIDKLALFAYWGGWITTFYMPLFFALSGIFFKPTNIITRQRGLLIPYLSFYSIGFILETAKQIAIIQICHIIPKGLGIIGKLSILILLLHPYIVMLLAPLSLNMWLSYSLI